MKIGGNVGGPNIGGGSGTALGGPYHNFTVEAITNQDVISSGGDTPSVVDDANTITQSDALIETNAILGISGVNNVDYVSKDEDIATVDVNGKVSWVSDGTARILAKSPYGAKHKNIAVSRLGGQTSLPTLASYVAGSFAKFCSDSVDAAIVGKNFATHGGIFTSMDHAEASYVRNPDCWCPADLTGLSPWNSHLPNGGQLFHGILIHPRISMHVGHYTSRPQVGEIVRWVDNNNVVYDRVIEAVSTIGDGTLQERDLCLHLYSEALPAEISVAKVMPAAWQTYLPHLTSSSDGLRIPTFVSDQLKNAYIQDIVSLASPNLMLLVPADVTRALFQHVGGPVSGDSGSPVAFVAGSELAAFGMISGLATTYSDNLAFINAEMNDLLLGAATTEYDLSGYTQY